MKKNNTKSKISTGTVVGIGAGIAALAAGSYYFFGPEGKKNRGKLKGWMIKMKGEIIEKMEDAGEMTEAAYHQIVDSVAEKYLGTNDGVKAFAESLKRQWKGISKTTKSGKRKSTAKKTTAKKAPAKKVTTKKVAAKKK